VIGKIILWRKLASSFLLFMSCSRNLGQLYILLKIIMGKMKEFMARVLVSQIEVLKLTGMCRNLVGNVHKILS
jgi:hypothetical protein